MVIAKQGEVTSISGNQQFLPTTIAHTCHVVLQIVLIPRVLQDGLQQVEQAAQKH
jgi:hypothetical protein